MDYRDSMHDGVATDWQPGDYRDTHKQKDTHMKLSELIERDGLEAPILHEGPIEERDGWKCYRWYVRIEMPNNPEQLSPPFYVGLGFGNVMPIDVMSSTVRDAQGVTFDDGFASFESWADDYDYDPDSRKAEAIYNEVKAQTEKLRTFLGDKFDDYMTCEVDD